MQSESMVLEISTFREEASYWEGPLRVHLEVRVIYLLITGDGSLYKNVLSCILMIDILFVRTLYLSFNACLKRLLCNRKNHWQGWRNRLEAELLAMTFITLLQN